MAHLFKNIINDLHHFSFRPDLRPDLVLNRKTKRNFLTDDSACLAGKSVRPSSFAYSNQTAEHTTLLMCYQNYILIDSLDRIGRAIKPFVNAMLIDTTANNRYSFIVKEGSLPCFLSLNEETGELLQVAKMPIDFILEKVSIACHCNTQYHCSTTITIANIDFQPFVNYQNQEALATRALKFHDACISVGLRKAKGGKLVPKMFREGKYTDVAISSGFTFSLSAKLNTNYEINFFKNYFTLNGSTGVITQKKKFLRNTEGISIAIEVRGLNASSGTFIYPFAIKIDS